MLNTDLTDSSTPADMSSASSATLERQWRGGGVTKAPRLIAECSCRTRRTSPLTRCSSRSSTKCPSIVRVVLSSVYACCAFKKPSPPFPFPFQIKRHARCAVKQCAATAAELALCEEGGQGVEAMRGLQRCQTARPASVR
jgi:hypothetical protein